MSVILHDKTRPLPDVMVVLSDGEPTTSYRQDEVLLAVEIVSPESAHRDRTVKFRSYAEAAIPHYWIIESEDGEPVVHVYEYDEPTKSYVAAGIFRDKLTRPVPFEISLDLESLAWVKPA